jgi:parvulin-like peptidyl-prolyl isomerase
MAILVNGEKIEDSQIQQEIELLRPEYEKAFTDMETSAREAQLLEWSRENLIERVLFRQAIQNSSQSLPDDKVDLILDKLKSKYKDPQDIYKEFGLDTDDKMKASIKVEAKVRLMLNDISKGAAKPTQDEIRLYYQENKEQFKTSEQVKMAMIAQQIDPQVDEQPALQAINQIYNEIKRGVPFELMLNRVTNGAGQIFVIARGQFAGEIDDVIFNLGPGQVSNVFRSRFGYHIAKVYARIPPGVADFNQVKDRIAEILQQRNDEAAFGQYLDKLREKAQIVEVA